MYSTVETFESDEVDAEGIKFLRAAVAFNESSGIGQQGQHAVEFKDPQWTRLYLGTDRSPTNLRIKPPRETLSA